MKTPQTARAVLALVAAYAVALQAVALGIAGAHVGGVTVSLICSHASGGDGPSTPSGHGHDPSAPCLGCCYVAAPSQPPVAGIAASEPRRTVVAGTGLAPAMAVRAAAANRPRAPPVG